jgi:hypothetical protein
LLKGEKYMKIFNLKRRLIFLGIIAAVIFALTPSANIFAGEPGAGCGEIEDGRWVGHAVHGSLDATFDGSSSVYLEVTIEGPPGCETEEPLPATVPWPDEDMCADPETGSCGYYDAVPCDELEPRYRRNVCRAGFYDLTPGEIRLVCFQNNDFIPCIPGDAWVQIVGAGNLVYNNEEHTSLTVNVVMMQVVEQE